MSHLEKYIIYRANERSMVKVKFFSLFFFFFHIETLERQQANHLFWRPTGQFIVLAGLRK